MSGRAEVSRHRQRIIATINRASRIPPEPELLSDFAKYLCVLVSGYVETAVKELLLEHTRKNAAPTLQRYVESQTRRLSNLNSERLQQVLGRFDPDWRDELAKILVDEKKEALDSIVSLRNNIAHGESVGITYRRVANYFDLIDPVIEKVADLCSPTNR